jgi:DNA-binding NarL/FixJ family response regulator
VGSIKVIGATCDFTEGVKVAQFAQPDIILLELKASGHCGDQGPNLNPLAAISQLLQTGRSSVIILTSYLDEAELDTAIGAGAKRYLLKDIDTEKLVSEIEAVAREQISV